MESKEQTLEALQAQLAAKEKELAAAKVLLEKSGAPAPVTGEYKGYRFLPGRVNVRDAGGVLLGSQAVLDAANAGDRGACAVLDRLISMGYSGLEKAGGKTAKKN